MKKMLIFLTFLCNFNVLAANPIKVAVLDTGLDLSYFTKSQLCPGEHKDFTGEGLDDIHGHGTNIIGLIDNNAKKANYCIVLIKIYGFKNNPYNPKSFMTQGLQYAYDIKASVINLSGGGLNPIETEREVVQKILDAKIILIAAAGNDRMNFDKRCNYYPACYDPRIYVVGNFHIDSNFGKTVDVIYNGNNQTAFGRTQTGTSQSTAIFTGKLLNEIEQFRNKR